VGLFHPRLAVLVDNGGALMQIVATSRALLGLTQYAIEEKWLAGYDSNPILARVRVSPSYATD